MNPQTIKQVLEKINKDKTFLDFKEKNPKAVLCAGFFILDFQNEKQNYTLDYKINGDIFSFKVPENKGIVTIKKEEIIDKGKPLEEIDPDIDVDINQLRELVEKELLNKEVKNKLEKIIAILQNIDDKTTWHLTCMCGSMKIIIMQVDPKSGEVIKFDERNLFDFVRKVGKK